MAQVGLPLLILARDGDTPGTKSLNAATAARLPGSPARTHYPMVWPGT
jgi:hypothetical protein